MVVLDEIVRDLDVVRALDASQTDARNGDAGIEVLHLGGTEGIPTGQAGRRMRQEAEGLDLLPMVSAVGVGEVEIGILDRAE